MACGVPVIATKVGAFEELIVEGETGHLVEIEDTDTIVSHLITLAQDRPARTRDSKAARAHVVDNFSIEAEEAAILRLYRELLKSA